ncbi:MAG TPA: DUF4440 domain-containing protein [Thermoanaerobaculia bacterium]|nr:DUF4440 domain-containing protein [Thermoanaerobaculia bacterium]
MHALSFFLLLVLMPGTSDTTAGDEKAIRAVQSELVSAWNAGRLDDLMKHYSDEAVILIAGMEPIEGREKIATISKAGMASGVRLASVTPIDISISGDLAVVRAAYVSVRPSSERQDSGMVLAVFRREGTAWRVAAESWTSGPDPAAR